MPRSTHAPFFPAPAALALGAALVAAVLVVSGCAQTASIAPSGGAKGGKDGTQRPESVQYPDIPIPRGAKRNVDKTVVVGTQTWFGQLSLDTGHGADAMFEFYTRELPNYGWRKIAAVRAPTSILSYDREERVLTVTIQPNRIRGSEVTITVSPREEPAPPAAPGLGGPAPVMPPPVRRRQ